MFKNYKQNNKRFVSGFTLIELMVSISIFAIIMFISLGAILSVMDGNKKNQTLQIAIGNLNYALENMTRLMKTGYNFSVSGSCNSYNHSISFTTTDDVNVTYVFAEQDTSDVGGLYYSSNSSEGFVTAEEIDINNLCFDLVGELQGDGLQPAVLITLKGITYGGKENVQTEFNLSTSITQRSVQY
jgi:prepilin-type N-terminal cleavage/methylation domain-containing protein